MHGRAFAKVNLMLRVRAPRSDGMHPIRSLVQSIDWVDEMTLDLAAAGAGSSFAVTGFDLAADDTNLAWKAVTAMGVGEQPEFALSLVKNIAVAAGLGGGSADAALGLALGAELFGRSPAEAAAAAGALGADVPFCLAGGTAVLEGIGDQVALMEPARDFAVAIVVPPFEFATPAVYRMWDQMGGSTGPGIDQRHLPASLRDHAPLINDLQPAALALEPTLGDWISDTAATWGQPVGMSGSGPALFSLFGSLDEATDAIGAIGGCRAKAAARPVPVGWEIGPGGTLPPPPWGVV